MLFVCLHINIYQINQPLISFESSEVYFAFSVRFGAAAVQFYAVLNFTFC